MYRKKSEGWFKHYDFVLFDLICIQLAFTVSYMIRHDGTIPYGNPLYRNMALFLGLVDIIFIILFEGYKDILKRGYASLKIVHSKRYGNKKNSDTSVILLMIDRNKRSCKLD